MLWVFSLDLEGFWFVGVYGSDETIVAQATAVGVGAVAIVRFSGSRAFEVLRKLTRISEVVSHRMVLVTVYESGGAAIDRALQVGFAAGRSYTGEESAELHLHGSPAVVKVVLDTAVSFGARLAMPGEFTFRAFRNGRIDLSQAEGVAALINSESESEALAAGRLLRGGLSSVVEPAIAAIEDLVVSLRARLDFPEDHGEDVESEFDLLSLKEQVDAVRIRLFDASADASIVGDTGRSIAFLGAPNVGKSSLLNRLAGDERVLVDEVPGTTRDPVEVRLGHGPASFSVWDTAGIRSTECSIETKGQRLGVGRAKRCDAVVWLVDATDCVWPEGEIGVSDPIVAGTKDDLLTVQQRVLVEAEACRRGFRFLGWTSAKNGGGIEELLSELGNAMRGTGSGELAMCQRHKYQLEQAIEALESAQRGLGENHAEDALLYDLEEALFALGGIVGRDMDAEVLERIFAEFCIGK